MDSPKIHAAPSAFSGMNKNRAARRPAARFERVTPNGGVVYLMVISFGLADSASFGISMCRTPSLNSALTFASSIWSI